MVKVIYRLPYFLERLVQEDLTNFLSKEVNLGYKLQYVTTDMDYANVTAIHNSCGDSKVQFCLWRLKRAISNKTVLQQDQANSRSYEFITNYSWFDLDVFNDICDNVDPYERVDKNLTEKTADIIAAAAGDSCFFHWVKEADSNRQNAHIRFTKTEDDLYGDFLKEIYDYVFIENRNLFYFQYLCKQYLCRDKYDL